MEANKSAANTADTVADTAVFRAVKWCEDKIRLWAFTNCLATIFSILVVGVGLV